MKPTIYDVAKEAGVSIATVSKVINHTGNMRPATRLKVKQAMERLNYRPNLMATALTGKATKTIGLLVPDISNPFFSEMARTIEDRAHEAGLSVIICSTDENEQKEKKYLELLQQKRVDGFIIASSFHDREGLKRLKEQGTPIVMLTQDDGGLGVPSISVDDYKGGFEATSYLITSGHKRIAVIAEHVSSSRLRIYGYKEAHASHGIPFVEEQIYKTTASTENGKFCLLTMHEKGLLPSAIFACNDLIAIGVIHGAKELGIRIPEDLSVIGFDNTILATTTVPALTTVAQPVADMGRKVVDLLLEAIETKALTNEKVLYTPELIIRGTTKNETIAT
ncbi:LacI family DNA-binding transcriptional regulator [Halalkalibacterium halodurans]|uniref:Transcriptional regulator involved in degradation n=1 Tax=Halalkalibacterium halodurans (strain ATCC BAA-125 / DSM 18197 / FERM 7344 / JCM 9153 / C-125) TaxID=272558 RepID=Q9KAR8_HALH5|nr:LacI family DNA-binding transcriptional regulator [Halalkalibacterium halodurans]MDY7222772.1 LacI family DNA-binding transcriptional regulator [Halalkalibacterium halodurans]MDY7241993.1 LacI family DNA-binding transcriptional regulator [Halalkalibacterium halodurans]MED4080996.1 LacI family DNA-binding transcriptional regulator [Halalkalibacterium halodurans]MED4085179.1 LacI family DNA-binding transcriptional regulator [Halalkalibacterium halodurans]MED4105243.1 LacI family DNA-binding t